MRARRIRWTTWGVLDSGQKRHDLGVQCEPMEPWRCRVWLGLRRVDHPSPVPVWQWEARRFGRGGRHMHISGEAAAERLCKAIAVAAAKAAEGTRGR